jgi:hypothetical protein
MMELASPDVVAARIAAPLRAAGFDLLAPFAVGWYNEHPEIAKLEGLHKLNAPAGCLAFIVGNSRALWPPFTRWVGQQLAGEARAQRELERFRQGSSYGRLAVPNFLETQPDVLDEYTRRVVRGVLGAPGLRDFGEPQVYFAYETVEAQGRAVSVTTAAHVAGLAFYNAEHQRSVHATLGPWIAYRTILVFGGVDAAALPRPPPPSDPYARSRPDRRCQPSSTLPRRLIALLISMVLRSWQVHGGRVGTGRRAAEGVLCAVGRD